VRLAIRGSSGGVNGGGQKANMADRSGGRPCRRVELLPAHTRTQPTDQETRELNPKNRI